MRSSLLARVRSSFLGPSGYRLPGLRRSAERRGHTLLGLIACQRTGTNLVREILNSNPAVAIWIEPFSNGPHFMCWHNFIKNQPVLPEDAAVALDKYVERIKRHIQEDTALYGGPKELGVVGLDVKYEHIRCADPVYINLQARPFLLDYFTERNARIIHLVRRNIIHTAISIIIANTRKVWHNVDGKSIVGRYRITPQELLTYANWVKESQSAFERLNDRPTQTIIYEDLVADLENLDDGYFRADSSLSAVAAFLNVPNRFRYNGHQQRVVNRPYSEILEGYSDLVQAVRESEFSEFADSL
jgi:hypothetical protein